LKVRRPVQGNLQGRPQSGHSLANYGAGLFEILAKTKGSMAGCEPQAALAADPGGATSTGWGSNSAKTGTSVPKGYHAVARRQADDGLAEGSALMDPVLPK
jgi:hypothetical protein